ncbi:MAG: acyl-CoA desaturase [Myxococcaceae bacterium]|nr:MAG: acyl-CoA desaturase [Myxococcaceae bacterium]
MALPLLARALREPVYGWTKDGVLSKPTNAEIMRAWRSRMDILHDRKTWIAVTGWFWTLALIPFGVVFLTKYFSWTLMLAGFLYSMVWIGTHGTVWLHRYSTHRAFTFRNRFARALCRELSIKIVPEETYVVSHHVHHAYSDQPGDPYNAQAGWLYCFLAAELHQPISRTLSPRDYEQVAALINHTGVKLNSYEQYQRWGTIAHPARTWAHFALNWAAWYGIFYLLGGHALATALFGWAAVWGIGIRAHNYDLHAGGKDRRRDGIEFDRRNLSINAFWPGLVAGEWHNNHHLFPQSVRAGFLWWQPDISFAFIRLYRLLGGITAWRNFEDKFFERHYRPWLAAKSGPAPTVVAPSTPDADEVDEAARPGEDTAAA